MWTRTQDLDSNLDNLDRVFIHKYASFALPSPLRIKHYAFISPQYASTFLISIHPNLHFIRYIALSHIIHIVSSDSDMVPSISYAF